MSDEVVVLRQPAPCTLAELAARIRPALEAAGALRAVAFGSWARGSADGFSDLDLAVVIDTDLPRFERAKLLDDVFAAIPGLAIDLVVYTPEEWEAGVRRDMDLFHTLALEGVVIHERSAR